MKKNLKVMLKVVVVFSLMLMLSFIVQYFFHPFDYKFWWYGAAGGAGGYAGILIRGNKKSNHKSKD